MKKYLWAIPFIMCLFLLAACGESSRNQESEYYDIRVEEEDIFNSQLPGYYYGFQFYGDDMIQIMLGATTKQEGVWLLRTDGSSEKLLPEYSDYGGSWFLTSQGQSILFYNSLTYGYRIQVLSREGEKLFSYDGVSGRSVCEMEDGRIYLLAEEDDNVFLAEMNLSTGTLRKLDGLSLNLERRLGLNVVPLQCLGTGPDGLMLMDCDGIWKIEEAENRASKSLVLSFDSTSYMDMISDPATNPNFDLRYASGFRVLEDGGVELLWRYRDSGRGLLQTLHYEKTKETRLRLRCSSLSSWMAERITEFNRTNGTYRVVIEQTRFSEEDFEDFRQRTDMEIGAGKGADMIFGIVSYNFSALQEKGALADLAPYLEKSGTIKEDYFPAAFARTKEQGPICGIFPELVCSSLWISRDVLAGYEGLDIGTVLDALLNYPEKGSFEGFPKRYILTFFLQGSEDLWGMVDYESGTCDFDTELFQKILNVAKRYSQQAYMDSPAILGDRDVVPLGLFESEAELLAQGKEAFGYFFDDGVYPMAPWGNILAVNEKSENKDGCWEFILFLLQEDSQRKLPTDHSIYPPSSRKVFAERQAYELEWSGKNEPITARLSYSHGECTEEDAAEQLELMEQIHFPSLDTMYIQDIIWDEAQDYIDGIKSMDVIIENINNRVQLFLDENRK